MFKIIALLFLTLLLLYNCPELLGFILIIYCVIYMYNLIMEEKDNE